MCSDQLSNSSSPCSMMPFMNPTQKPSITSLWDTNNENSRILTGLLVGFLRYYFLLFYIYIYMHANNGTGLLEQLSQSFIPSQSASFYRIKQGRWKQLQMLTTGEEVLFVTKSFNNFLANSRILKVKRLRRPINKAAHTSCFEQYLLVIV